MSIFFVYNLELLENYSGGYNLMNESNVVNLFFMKKLFCCSNVPYYPCILYGGLRNIVTTLFNIISLLATRSWFKIW